MYSREKSLREDRVPQRRRTPSFSSSLLDAIYRSIDDEIGNVDDDFALYRETTTRRKKQSTTATTIATTAAFVEEDECQVESLRRAIMIEKWTENQRIRTSRILHSTSSSSDSSSGGAFSSSETESVDRIRSTPSCFTPIRSKPFRTCVSSQSDRSEKPNPEEGLTKITKLRALKIYGDLKKVKPPISPGRRIASFLNSLFNAKKEKVCSVDLDDVRSEKKSKSTTCSSASSFSRSCLSKTPTSRGKLSNGTKRSVRFYPVSVIVDEDCRPCGHKSIYEDDPSLLPMPLPGVKKFSATPFLSEEVKNHVEQAREILRGYQEKKNKYGFEVRDLRVTDEDDDAESYASSDLFELDNINGVGRYREELPVYETTNLKRNHAIAHGLLL